MYSRNINFAIWCAKRCVHLWKAPAGVKKWLENPKPDTIGPAWESLAAKTAAWAVESAPEAAETAATEAVWAGWAGWAASAAKTAVWSAAKALGISVTDLRLEYVRTWTMDELEHAEDDWIEPATVELFDRMAKDII